MKPHYLSSGMNETAGRTHLVQLLEAALLHESASLIPGEISGLLFQTR